MSTHHPSRVNLTAFDRDLLEVSPECLALYLELESTAQSWVRQYYYLGHSITRCVADASRGLYADGFD